MNTYEQPENKLTYNFLWLVQYLNNTAFLEFLSGTNNISESDPIINIETVYGGGESNPDGSIKILLNNGEVFTLFIESKTFRRGLDLDQINRHIKNYITNNDILLVITPRESDKKEINNLNEKSIILLTWQNISNFIIEKFCDDTIVNEFVEYGNLKGEFTIMKDISSSDINIISDFYKNNMSARLWNVFESLSEDIKDIFNKYNIKVDSTKVKDHWGRLGIEIYFKKPKLDIWAFFGLYYHKDDHNIEFKIEEIPDISFFIDLNENEKKIDNNKDIIKDFKLLEKYGFRCNDNGRLTSNRWRLIAYQKSIIDFESLSIDLLKKELNDILSKFKKSKYFINFLIK